MHALGFALLSLALLLAARVLPLDRPPLSLFACPLREATGWPCLFCGCTHAFAHAVRGEFVAAFLASPLGTVLAIAAVLHLLVTLARLAGLRLALPELEVSARMRWAGLALLAINWAFVAARVRGVI